MDGNESWPSSQENRRILATKSYALRRRASPIGSKADACPCRVLGDLAGVYRTPPCSQPKKAHRRSLPRRQDSGSQCICRFFPARKRREHLICVSRNRVLPPQWFCQVGWIEARLLQPFALRAILDPTLTTFEKKASFFGLLRMYPSDWFLRFRNPFDARLLREAANCEDDAESPLPRPAARPARSKAAIASPVFQDSRLRWQVWLS